MGLSQKDQTKHNTLLHLGTQSVKIRHFSIRLPVLRLDHAGTVTKFHIHG